MRAARVHSYQIISPDVRARPRGPGDHREPQAQAGGGEAGVGGGGVARPARRARGPVVVPRVHLQAIKRGI